MRIGKPKDIENRSVLYDLVTESVGCYDRFGGMGLPDECRLFIKDQYRRFGLSLPVWEDELINLAAETTFYYSDIINPYVLLLEFSDVTMTSDWANHTYLMSSENFNETPIELDPQKTETYRFVKGQCEHWFEYFMSHPGLEAIPNDVGTNLSEQISSVIEDMEWRMEDEYIAKDIRNYCKDKIFNYFDLASWAAFAWLAGPYGRDFRVKTHECFELCLIYGEAVLYDTYWVHPNNYKKIERPPGSCVECGLDSWCNDLTFIEGQTIMICENCLNGGKQIFGQQGCGTKYCKYWECEYHPMNGKTMGSRYKILGENGQLLKLIGGNDATYTTSQLFHNGSNKLVTGLDASSSKEGIDAKMRVYNNKTG